MCRIRARTSAPIIENPFDRRRRPRPGGLLGPPPAERASSLRASRSGAGKVSGEPPAVVNDIAGGWTVSTVFYFETGRYFYAQLQLAAISPEPALPAGGPTASPTGTCRRRSASVARGSTPAAFSIPAANSGRFGNCGVNTLEGPGLNTQHLAVAKRFLSARARPTWSSSSIF